MNDREIPFLLMGSVMFITFSVSMFFSERYVYKRWAKSASVLICMCWMVWAVGRIIQGHWEMSQSARTILDVVRKCSAGIGVGALLAFIIARPYKKVTQDKQPPLA